MKLFHLLIALIFGASMRVCAQADHYIVKINGDTVKGVISMSDWNYTPQKIKIKTIEGIEIVERDENISVIFVSRTNFYIRKYCEIVNQTTNSMVISSENIKTVTKRNLLLRPILIGVVSLYTYQDLNSGKRFFIEDKDGKMIELVYFKYLKKIGSKDLVLENSEYKQILAKIFTDCTSDNQIDFNIVPFNASSFISLLEKYNICKGSSYEIFLDLNRKPIITFGIVTGISGSGLLADKSIVSNFNSPIVNSFYGADYNTTVGGEIGGALNIKMPSNKGRHNLLIEAKYQLTRISGRFVQMANATQFFNSDRQVAFQFHYLRTTVQYRNISRLNDKANLFFNAGGTLAGILALGSKITYNDTDINGLPRSDNNARSGPFFTEFMQRLDVGGTAGIGLEFNKRFSFECRFLLTNGFSKAENVLFYAPIYTGSINFTYWLQANR